MKGIRLPLHCEVRYYPNFLSPTEAQALYRQLIKEYELPTLKTALHLPEGVRYTDYGKLMFIDHQLLEENTFPEAAWGKAVPWPASLLSIRARLEAKFDRTFQVCVCIYYPDGNSGVDFHSDYIAFGDTKLIPSLSLGEERNFLLREKSSQEVYEILLEEGSLLLMGDRCQEDYEHSLPTDSRYRNGRINLTFRPYGFA